MAIDRSAQMQALDPAVLTSVVRQDLRRPDFEITDWAASRLSDRGFATPDGLWRVTGAGRDRDGERPWAVVVKIIPRQDSPPPETDIWHWRREPLLAQSGLADALPGRVRAPRFYRVDEQPDAAWVWMELAADARRGPWTLADYVFAGRQMGVWNGTAFAHPRPTPPWLARDHCRTWLKLFNPEQEWLFPLHAKHVSADLRQRHDRFWAERETFCQVLERLPQVVSHCDLQRRNMFISQAADGADELLLVDWAFIGWLPIGAEPAMIGPVSALVMAYPPTQVAAWSKAVFDGYVSGLRETGWTGDVQAARLAFLAWTALWVGSAFTGFVAWGCGPESRDMAVQQFGAAEEALYLAWLPLLGYTMDCADEARELMGRLGLG